MRRTYCFLIVWIVAAAAGFITAAGNGCATRVQEKPAVANAAHAAVAIEKAKDGSEALEVRINGEHFTTYHYSNEEKKPYLWPVLSEGGVGMTRDWPMGKQDVSKDHQHHKSLWSAYGDVNGADCWAEEANSGFQHTNDVKCESGDTGTITAKDTWLANDQKPVVDEEREYHFYATPASARMFDVTVTFKATQGDVLFKDTKEGGIVSLRMRDDLAGSRKGVITLSDGRTGEAQCWGKPSPWCDYSGPIEGVGVRGVAVFDNPANLRHPTCWHVRNYGLMGANCFGLSYFTEKDPTRLNGDYTLKSGDSLTFKYRVYVHSGDVKQAKVAERCAEYLSQPDKPPAAELK